MKIKNIFKNEENLCYHVQRGEQNVFCIYNPTLRSHENTCPTKPWAIKNTVLQKNSILSGISSLHLPCNVLKTYYGKYSQHRVVKKTLILLFLP